MYESGSAGLWSTIDHYVKFARLFLGDGAPRMVFALLARSSGIVHRSADYASSSRASRGVVSARRLLSIAVGINDAPQGLELAKRSVRLFDDGLSRRPNDRLLLSRRAHALRNLARAYWRTHNLHAARATVEQAIRMHQELLSQSPNDRYEGAELIRSRQLLATLNDRTPIVKQ